jgi:hypothetical protein
MSLRGRCKTISVDFKIKSGRLPFIPSILFIYEYFAKLIGTDDDWGMLKLIQMPGEQKHEDDRAIFKIKSHDYKKLYNLFRWN